MNKAVALAFVLQTVVIAPALAASVDVTVVNTSGGAPVTTTQSHTVRKRTSSPSAPTVRPDLSKRYQTMDGFGASLTNACVDNLLKLPEQQRTQLLTKIFSRERGDGFTYLRVPVGTNDYARENFTYADDEKKGVAGFSMERDAATIRLLKEIKAINPDLSIMLTPWTAPAWMKNNGALNGGYLKPESRKDYARYLTKAVKAYADAGLTPRSMSVINEPHTPMDGNYNWMWPAMLLAPVHDLGQSTEEKQRNMAHLEGDFIVQDLVPELKREGLRLELYLNDHTYADAKWYQEVLSRPDIQGVVAGTAYHCYDGDLTMVSDFQKSIEGARIFTSLDSGCDQSLAARAPDGLHHLLEWYEDFHYKALSTECSAPQSGFNVVEEFKNWLNDQGIDSVKLGMSGTMGWNLCLDQKGGPTNETSEVCKGDICRPLVSIDQSKSPPEVTYNSEYQALALMSRAAPKGSQVVDSQLTGSSDKLNVLSFISARHGYSVVISNASDKDQNVEVLNERGEAVTVTVPKMGGTTVRWKSPAPARGSSK